MTAFSRELVLDRKNQFESWNVGSFDKLSHPVDVALKEAKKQNMAMVLIISQSAAIPLFRLAKIYTSNKSTCAENVATTSRTLILPSEKSRRNRSSLKSSTKIT